MTSSLLTKDPHTKRRNATERRFRAFGLSAIVIALAMLVWLLVSILSAGTPAFRQSFLTFPVLVDEKLADKEGTRDTAKLAKVTTLGYGKMLAASLAAEIDAKGIDMGDLKAKELAKMISEESAATLRDLVLADPSLIGQTIPFTALASGRIDGYFKGRVTMESAAKDKNTSPEQLMLADRLREAGILTIDVNPAL